MDTTATPFGRELLFQYNSEIQKYDVKIEDGQGSKSAGKRAIKNRLAAESPIDVSPVINWFDQMPNVEARAAAYVKFEKALTEKYLNEIDAYIEAQIQPSDGAKLTEEELNKIIAERKVVVGQYNAIVNVWKMLKPEDKLEDLPPIKKMSGGRGKRGPRAITQYQFSVNGTELPAEKNSLSYIATLVPDWKVKDLREYVTTALSTEEKPFLFKSPPESFAFTLPNNVSVSARKMVVAENDDDDDDENDNDDDD